MKKLFVLITALSIICCVTNDCHSTAYWAKTYGLSKLENVFVIEKTPDEKFILAGFTNAVGAGFCDYLVLKIDEMGYTSWQKIYGGSSLDRAFALKRTLDEGYIIAGVTSSFEVSSYDLWLLKLDSGGNVSWQKTYGGSDSEWNVSLLELLDIEQTADGGYIVAGHTSSFGAGGYDMWILKLNPDGTVNWEKTYGGSNDDYAVSIEETSEGDFAVLGYTNSFGAGNSDIWVLTLDSTGGIIWEKTYGGSGSEEGHYIQEEDGAYILVGSTDSFGSGGSDILVVKLASDGTVFWQKTFGAIQNDEYGDHVRVVSDGYIVAGRTFSCGAGEDDNLVLKLDTEGTLMWQKTYGGTNAERIPSILQTADEGYLMVTSTSSFGSGSDDFLVVKVDDIGEIPECGLLGFCDILTTDTLLQGQNTTASIQLTNATVNSTSVTPETIAVEIDVLCTNDNDGDGIPNQEDNCQNHPNGTLAGTCTQGNLGDFCTQPGANVTECGTGGFCSMVQEDTYPPGGNGCGDVCECEGNIDDDEDQDGSDAATFKVDFGRSLFFEPCINSDTCNGDFDCDGDEDGTDAAKFKEDFGRSPFSDPCPYCPTDPWCTYP
jgi:hypothetical protein